jgi:hypothetical protein
MLKFNIAAKISAEEAIRLWVAANKNMTVIFFCTLSPTESGKT